MPHEIGLTLPESSAERPPEPYRRGAPNVILMVERAAQSIVADLVSTTAASGSSAASAA